MKRARVRKSAPMSVAETMRERRRRKLVLACLCLAGTLLFAGCGGSLYKVKPVVAAPITEAGRSAEAGGISLRAVPLLTDEESQELFEANLPLAGLLPVRVEISNTSGAPLVLKSIRFRLADATGNRWKSRSASQAVSRILKADDVTLYNPQARARFLEDFRRHALDTATPLGAAQRRQGLIFFETPKKAPVESPRALLLTIEGLAQPLELHLN